MTTKHELTEDYSRAIRILQPFQTDLVLGKGLLLISADYGTGVTDYFKVMISYVGQDGTPHLGHLTWALSKVSTYSLRNRRGYWFLALGGGGYSKADAIAQTLADFYGVERIRYELI